MNDSEAIEGGRATDANCPNCGCALTSGAQFCGNCGARIADFESTSLSRLIGGMTMGWVAATLFTLVATDLLPSAVWIILFPLIIVLAMVAYLVPYALVIVQAIYRFGRRHYPPLGPGLQALVACAWAFVCLLYTSEPLVEPFTAMPLLFFGLALLVSWVLFVIPAAWGVRRRGGWRRTQIIAGYLLPLPVVIGLLLSGSSYSLRVRFELSEGALHDRAQRFERGELIASSGSDVVGLYTVEHVDRRYGCTILQTNSGIDMAGGFAYCADGNQPMGDFVRADHLELNWWKYVYDSNGTR